MCRDPKLLWETGRFLTPKGEKGLGKEEQGSANSAADVCGG